MSPVAGERFTVDAAPANHPAGWRPYQPRPAPGPQRPPHPSRLVARELQNAGLQARAVRGAPDNPGRLAVLASLRRHEIAAPSASHALCLETADFALPEGIRPQDVRAWALQRTTGLVSADLREIPQWPLDARLWVGGGHPAPGGNHELPAGRTVHALPHGHRNILAGTYEDGTEVWSDYDGEPFGAFPEAPLGPSLFGPFANRRDADLFAVCALGRWPLCDSLNAPPAVCDARAALVLAVQLVPGVDGLVRENASHQYVRTPNAPPYRVLGRQLVALFQELHDRLPVTLPAPDMYNALRAFLAVLCDAEWVDPKRSQSTMVIFISNHTHSKFFGEKRT